MPKINASNLAEHREHTMNSLLDAVDELAGERGLENVSLRDIASRAGVARTAVYNYATDKSALLVAATERSTAGIRLAVDDIATGDAPAAERVDRIVSALVADFTQSARQIFAARALQQSLSAGDRERSLASFRDRIRQSLAAVVREGTSDGTLGEKLDPELTADLIIGALEAAVARCIDRPADAEVIGVQTVAFLRAATRVAL